MEPLLDGEIDENKLNVELNCLDIEVTIDGTIITTTGTEATDENGLQSNSLSKSIGDVQSNIQNPQTLEVVETDCNYCDCLRPTSITKEADT